MDSTENADPNMVRVMSNSGRYAVCDETRRAPNNEAPLAGTPNAIQHWGEDGECQRFDDLREAKHFAETIVWEQITNKRHLVVVRDREDTDKVVFSFDPVGKD